jgi:hypothetical protein
MPLTGNRISSYTSGRMLRQLESYFQREADDAGMNLLGSSATFVALDLKLSTFNHAQSWLA